MIQYCTPYIDSYREKIANGAYILDLDSFVPKVLAVGGNDDHSLRILLEKFTIFSIQDNRQEFAQWVCSRERSQKPQPQLKARLRTTENRASEIQVYTMCRLHLINYMVCGSTAETIQHINSG